MSASASIRLPSEALRVETLGGQHLVLQREHAGRGLVNPAYELDRALEDRPDARRVLDASRLKLVLDDEVRVRYVER